MGVKVKLSIICVTYNAAKHLESFLKSIRNYKPEDAELIIFDGNSTDETLTIIQKNNDIISFAVSEPDNGIYDAMNKAVKKANGDWLYFIGADDELLNSFTNCTSYFKESNCIYFADILMGENIIERSADPYQMAKYNISHQALFYPKQVFDDYSYNLEYKICADYDLNLRLRGDTKYSFFHIPETIAKFGIEGLSSQQTDLNFEHQKATLIKNYLGFKLYIRFLFRKFKHNIQGKHVK